MSNRFEPTNHHAAFEGNVFHAFIYLGRGFLCFVIPKQATEALAKNTHNALENDLIPKKAFTCLILRGLVEAFEPPELKHYGDKVKTQYRFTEKGNEVFNEIYPNGFNRENWEKPRKMFLERFKPDYRNDR